MKMLFVGGSQDGSRHEIPQPFPPELYYATKQQYIHQVDRNNAVTHTPVLQRYNLTEIRDADGAQIKLYVLQKLGPYVVSALVFGYHEKS